FQADCHQLCEQHYPTVHNRGMRENHLGKALCRRIITTLQQDNIAAQLQQCQSKDSLAQPIFQIETEQFTVWVIAHRLLSANIARRNSLIAAIEQTKQKLNPNKPQHLVLVADHWFDRSKASKEIPAWWLGELPANALDYQQDGVKLLVPNSDLPSQLNDAFGFVNGEHQIHHPLKREQDDKTVYKYIVLTAYYPL
ncbi:hypothetical protein, partial [Photobacterium sanctipauli]